MVKREVSSPLPRGPFEGWPFNSSFGYAPGPLGGNGAWVSSPPASQLFINPGPGVCPSTPLATCENQAVVGLGNNPDNAGPFVIEFQVKGFKPSLGQRQETYLGLTDDTFTFFSYVGFNFQPGMGHTVIEMRLGGANAQVDLGAGFPDGDYTIRVEWDGDNWEAFYNNISVGSGSTGPQAASPYTRCFVDMFDAVNDGVYQLTRVHGGVT